MIKKGLKNYFIGLKYFFTPLGTMFLGMMLGFSVLIPGVISAVTNLIDGIKALSESVSLDFNELWNRLWAMVTELDWNEPFESLGTLFSAEWLNNALTEALSTILGTDFETFKTIIIELVAQFIKEIGANIFVFFVFCALGFVAGFILTKALIRRNIARRTIGKRLLFSVVNSVLTAAFTLAAAYLSLLWEPSAIFIVILLPILIGFYALLEAFLLYGVKKIKLKTVVNGKNVGLYLLVNLIIVAISGCFTLLIVLINKVLGLFVGLSVFIIAIVVMGANAESYVKQLAENSANENIGGQNPDEKDKEEAKIEISDDGGNSTDACNPEGSADIGEKTFAAEEN